MEIWLLNATKTKLNCVPLVIMAFFLVFSIGSCKKDQGRPSNEEGIKVSFMNNKDTSIAKFNLSADGLNDTLYVFSDSKIVASINEASPWIKIVDLTYNESTKSYRVILKGDPMGDNYLSRIGELDISNAAPYMRKFVQLNQGYHAYLNEEFSWLHYGHGNPLLLNEGVLIKDWTPAQKANNWTANVSAEESLAYVYGKDGYVQMGSGLAAANILSPILSGVQNDSLLLLTFNAVGYVSELGVKDQDKLTVKIAGGLFNDGKNNKEITLGYYDYTSALIEQKMWGGSFFKFVIKKSQATPLSSTIQVEFITGDGGVSGHPNRLFIDNVRIFSVEKYENPDLYKQ